MPKLEFVDPIEGGGGCNMNHCGEKAITYLRIPMELVQVRLCVGHLKELQQAVIIEVLATTLGETERPS